MVKYGELNSVIILPLPAVELLIVSNLLTSSLQNAENDGKEVGQREPPSSGEGSSITIDTAGRSSIVRGCTRIYSCSGNLPSFGAGGRFSFDFDDSKITFGTDVGPSLDFEDSRPTVV